MDAGWKQSGGRSVEALVWQWGLRPVHSNRVKEPGVETGALGSGLIRQPLMAVCSGVKYLPFLSTITPENGD